MGRSDRSPRGRSGLGSLRAVQRHARDRAVGRIVTYSLVVILLGAAAIEIEAWPISAFTLFSQPRTERSIRLELVTLDDDGSRSTVSFAGTERALPNHAQQLQRLREVAPAEQMTRVRALLDVAGVDPSTVDEVHLERVVRTLDPDGGRPTEIERKVVAEIPF